MLPASAGPLALDSDQPQQELTHTAPKYGPLPRPTRPQPGLEGGEVAA